MHEQCIFILQNKWNVNIAFNRLTDILTSIYIIYRWIYIIYRYILYIYIYWRKKYKKKIQWILPGSSKTITLTIEFHLQYRYLLLHWWLDNLKNNNNVTISKSLNRGKTKLSITINSTNYMYRKMTVDCLLQSDMPHDHDK